MSKIAIKAFIDTSKAKKDQFNLGLENYNQVVFQGVSHKMSIWAKEDVAGSGNDRFITGLNEFAPELNKLSEEDKKAKVVQIRSTVASLEGSLASNRIDPELKNKDFWKQVKRLGPDNHDFWNSISIAPSNDPIFLDPTEPEDIIKIFAIEAGGFPDIAPSLEAAKISSKAPKFYLDKLDETAKSNAIGSIEEARAKGILLRLYEEDLNKLLYVAKAIDVNSSQYKNKTPGAVLFGNMNAYIEGKSGTLKTLASTNFSKVVALDMETLKIRAIVKDATFYRLLTVRSGQIYEGYESETPLGYNIAEVVEFLKNPLNEAVLHRLKTKVEKYWAE